MNLCDVLRELETLTWEPHPTAAERARARMLALYAREVMISAASDLDCPSRGDALLGARTMASIAAEVDV